MSHAAQHVTWTTHGGDTVKVYALAEPGEDGGTKVTWTWRRTHRDGGGRILARGVEPKKHRRIAIWEAQRVNPPINEVALKPAPGTDTSTEDALHRVLDLADELETGPLLVRGDSTAARIRAAVARPQRDHDEEGGQ